METGKQGTSEPAKETREPGASPEAPEEPFHLTKEAINALPLIRYQGTVRVVNAPALVEPAVEVLRMEEVLGFDTETKPSFRKGVINPPSVMQLAGSRAVYIFQLDRVGGVRAVSALLEAPQLVKAGVSIARDVRELQALAPFEPVNFVELADLSTQAGIKNNGLRGLVACLLGGRISKSAKTTDWSRGVLSEAQVIYAATDAWASREVYLRLMALRRIPR